MIRFVQCSICIHKIKKLKFNSATPEKTIRICVTQIWGIMQEIFFTWFIIMVFGAYPGYIPEYMKVLPVFTDTKEAVCCQG